ncbi:MAG TPA: DUF488 domain-containing protein [Solirubrobacteraceae bacterium]|nr:DUF488 domain-containing protein [Solirubrobacteraceae bacterium]
MRRTAYTVGHSTHELQAFVALLRGAGVGGIADVRRWPRSRRHPQFDDDALAVELPLRGIAYDHLPALGGRRRPVPGSPNDGWQQEAFRGYADHMATREFAAGLERLEELCAARPTAAMCAEAPWWRCHRRLVADALLARGWDVLHLAPGGRAARHELPEFAVVADGLVTYPAAQLRLGG